MNTPSLGEARVVSTATHPVSDDIRIPERIEIGAEPGLQFELVGPRAKLFFDPKQSVSSTSRSNCLLVTPNALILPAVGGALSSL